MIVFIFISLISSLICTSTYGQSLDQLSARSNNASLIIGGSIVHIRDYGYTVFIRIRIGSVSRRCAGAALSYLMILTAAHCLDNEPRAQDITIIIGVSNINQHPHAGVMNVFVAVSYLQHDEYDRTTQSNDVGLVGTTIHSHGLEFRYAIMPTEDRPTPAPPLDVTALGWGLTSMNARRGSDDLKAVTIPVVHHTVCDALVMRMRGRHITPDTFCAGDLGRDTRNTCHGDSGGPVVDHNELLVGIVSRGLNCEPNGGIFLPSLHVSVARVRRWIHTIVGF